MSGPTNAILQALSFPEPRAQGRHPGWLKELRRSAFQWVSDHGFPTAKDEAWKYARVTPIVNSCFQQADPDASRRMFMGAIDPLAGDFGGPRMVFVNGYFVPELSSLQNLPKGIEVRSLAAVLDEGGEPAEAVEALLSRPFREQPHGFTALNAALAEDGAFVRVAPHTTVEEPIHLVFLSNASAAPLMSHPRSVVLAGAGSRATIVESYTGFRGDVTLTNAVTDVVLEDDAVIEHYKVQNEAETAFHVALLNVRQGRDSRFSTHSSALGSSIARHEVRVVLEAPGAQVVLNGLYMPRDEQHLDNPTTIDHAAPRCRSRELYKGVIDGRGRGVFDGRIIVRPGAMMTDAGQTNKILLLSESARADTRPWLEIFADDVKCSHGAAVGQLDEEALFYLRSRGIPQEAARGLLTYAFTSEMLDLIRVEPLRLYVTKRVAARLHAGGAAVAA